MGVCGLCVQLFMGRTARFGATVALQRALCRPPASSSFCCSEAQPPETVKLGCKSMLRWADRHGTPRTVRGHCRSTSLQAVNTCLPSLHLLTPTALLPITQPSTSSTASSFSSTRSSFPPSTSSSASASSSSSSSSSSAGSFPFLTASPASFA